MKKVFGIKEENFTSLADGLKKMADWAKKTGVKKSGKFEGIEILEKLPKVWLED
jgi:hypothetical protein